MERLAFRKAVPGSGGAGADTLTGGGGADTFNYLTGDASTLTFTATSGETAETPLQGSQYSNLEVITDFNTGGADKMTLGNADLVSTNTGDFTVQANDFEVVFGQYNSGTHTFTVGDQSTGDATNGDAIVLWDGDAAADVQLEAVVLVGVDLSKAATLTGHDLTFA